MMTEKIIPGAYVGTILFYNFDKDKTIRNFQLR